MPSPGLCGHLHSCVLTHTLAYHYLIANTTATKPSTNLLSGRSARQHWIWKPSHMKTLHRATDEGGLWTAMLWLSAFLYALYFVTFVLKFLNGPKGNCSPLPIGIFEGNLLLSVIGNWLIRTSCLQWEGGFSDLRLYLMVEGRGGRGGSSSVRRPAWQAGH